MQVPLGDEAVCAVFPKPPARLCTITGATMQYGHQSHINDRGQP